MFLTRPLILTLIVVAIICILIVYYIGLETYFTTNSQFSGKFIYNPKYNITRDLEIPLKASIVTNEKPKVNSTANNAEINQNKANSVTYEKRTVNSTANNTEINKNKANNVAYEKPKGNSTANNAEINKNNSDVEYNVFHTKNNTDCIPNIVHWLWFYKKGRELQFYQCISMLSVLYKQRPENVYIWSNNNNNLPCGPWWDVVLAASSQLNIPIISKNMSLPTEIGHWYLNFVIHQTDISRIAILHEFGGIYMDFDVVLLRSLQPLMCSHEMVLGGEMEWKVNNGFMLAKPGAQFIKTWLNYNEFDFRRSWDYINVETAFNLWQLNKGLVHIELRTFNHPNFRGHEFYTLTQAHYDWSNNYGIHTWYRMYKVVHNPSNIRNLNTTMGQLFRLVWYGSPDLLLE